MKIAGLITEDFVNYKKPSMTIMFPHCTMKCGAEHCQNYELLKANTIEIPAENLVERYMNNPITDSIVMQGLEPFDSVEDLLSLIDLFRRKTSDDIVIYTGYTEEEIKNYTVWLKDYENIIIKFGRYIPGQKEHYDEILGIYLASDNQYAKVVSYDQNK